MNQRRFWFLNKDAFEQLYTQISVSFLDTISVGHLASVLHQITDIHETLSSGLTKDENSVFPLQTPFYHEMASVEILPDHTYENWLKEQENVAASSNAGSALPIRFFIFSDPQQNVTRLVYKVYSFWCDLYGGLKILDNISAVLENTSIPVPGNEDFIIHRNFAAWQNEMIADKDNEGLDF